MKDYQHTNWAAEVMSMEATVSRTLAVVIMDALTFSSCVLFPSYLLSFLAALRDLMF
jgi:hypothetical protein